MRPKPPLPPDTTSTHTRRQFLVNTVVVGTAACLPQAAASPENPSPTDGGAGSTVGDGGGMADLDAGSADAGGSSGAGADAGGAADAGPLVLPSEIAEVALFPQGVASGDATPDSAVLWTLFNGANPLHVMVWRVEDDALVALVADQEVTPGDGGFVHVDVQGLNAGQRYAYAFVEWTGGARSGRSPVGRFRAALGPMGMDALVVGAVACTRNGDSFATLERAAERDDLDVFLLLGDTTYNDGADSITAFRRKWAENMTTAGYRGVRGATSVLATWDDHEVDNDWTPENVNLSRFQTARQAFFEHQPVRRSTVDSARIWRSFRWGLTAEFFVLDCRGERKPSTRTSGNAEYLSTAQMDWLRAGLMASPSVFKVILNSVPIGNFPALFDVAARDRWEGYASQRTAILRLIDETPIPGVLWVSGDFHLASVGRVSTEGNPGANQLEFLVGPGAQSANPLAGTLRPPQWDWASGTNNYATLELEPVTRTVRIKHHGGDARSLSERSFTV